MPPTPRPIILPSENQTREFDAKLLLACIMAEKGVSVYVGARHDIHNYLHKFPASIYLAKDFRRQSCRVFTILEQLGHHMAGWDEEGLLMYSDDLYYKNRIAQPAFSMVKEFYAWGEINQNLIQNAPGYTGAPVHRTGNPRLDLLRPELRSFFDEDVKKLQDRFGNFFLICSNFGKLNSVVPSQRYKQKPAKVVADGEPDNVLDDIWVQRKKILQSFLRLVPQLSKAFPDINIIVRPHPSEDHALWKKAAEGSERVHILHEGNVIPWLLAAKAMIHNSCSTGLEAFMLDRQSISYQPIQTDTGQIELPNTLSYPVSTEDELFETLKNRLTASESITRNDAQFEMVDKFAEAQVGDLASERIAELLLKLLDLTDKLPKNSVGNQLIGNVRSRWRRLNKTIGHNIPNSKSSKEHNLHRFPTVSNLQVEEKIKKLANSLSRFKKVSSSQVDKNIFLITSEAGS